MAEKQETHADIIAWLRRPREGENAYLTLWRDEIADRLEAAHKRERESTDAKIADLQSRVKLWTARSAELVNKCNEYYANAHRRERGDRAKLREALQKAAESAAEIMERVRHKDGLAFNTANYIASIAKDALAAPPRNCDVGTAEEQSARFDMFCYDRRSYEKGCGGCPLIGEPCCELAWAQMPYKEEDAK